MADSISVINVTNDRALLVCVRVGNNNALLMCVLYFKHKCEKKTTQHKRNNDKNVCIV
jgi:hypothetical protein